MSMMNRTQNDIKLFSIDIAAMYTEKQQDFAVKQSQRLSFSYKFKFLKENRIGKPEK